MLFNVDMSCLQICMVVEGIITQYRAKYQPLVSVARRNPTL